MHDIQTVFYWVGTFALGLLGIFLLAATIFIIFASYQVKRLSRRFGVVLTETYLLIQGGKRFGSYLKSSLTEKLIATVLKIIKRD